MHCGIGPSLPEVKMTRLTLFAGLFLAAGPASAASAEVAPGTQSVSMTVRGVPQPLFRIERGKALTLHVTGPATVRFELRVEGAPPTRPVIAEADLDGKQVARVPVRALADPEAHGDRGPITKATPIPVTVPPGKHVATLSWPASAGADALVAVEGVPLPLPALAKEEPLPSLVSPARPTPAHVESAPPPPPPAEAQTRTVTAFSDHERPAERAPASSVAAGPEKLGPWGLELQAGAGHSAQTYVPPSTVGLLSLGASYRATEQVPVFARLSLRFSNQAYLGKQPAFDGAGLAGATLSETRTDFSLGTGYDLGGMLLHSGKLVAMPTLALKLAFLTNEAFPSKLIGLELGARLAYSLTPALAVFGQAAVAPNFTPGTSASALGPPKSDTTLVAGVSLPLGSGFALDAFFQSDLLAFEYDLRATHGGAVALHANF